MPHTRRQPRIASGGRITVRLTTQQRDWFVRSPETPKNLGHALHRAPVQQGRLSVRLSRDEIDALIRVAASLDLADKKADRALSTLLRYLESLEDRFEEPEFEAEESSRSAT